MECNLQQIKWFDFRADHRLPKVRLVGTLVAVIKAFLTNRVEGNL